MTAPARTEAQLAQELIVLGEIKRQADERIKAVKAEAQTILDVGDRKVAKLPDGALVGAITHAHGATGKAYVSDERAFRAWVKATRPDHIEVVERVISSWQSVVLDACTKEGAAVMVDPVTAEMVDVPGVTVAEDAPSTIRVNPTKEAAAAIAKAWQSLPVRKMLGAE